jgi:peptide/nickel transport system substrate-binding protein
MKKKRLSAIVGCVFLILVLVTLPFMSACATSTTSTPAPTSALSATSSTTQGQKPQYGGTLKIIGQTGAVNWGYPGAKGAGGDVPTARHVVECLLDIDENCDTIPKLATDYKYSPDYLSLTLTLRKGVKFHDGTDFNAQAAKTSLDLARSQLAELKIVTSVDVIDDYTIRLNLSASDPGLLLTISNPVYAGMVSPTALKTMGKDCMLHPVGTGPFKFVSYERDVLLKLERFNDYWQKGKPYLDGIEWHFIADPVTRLLSFKAGEAQVATSLNTKDVADLKAEGKYNVTMVPAAIFGLCGDSAHPDSPFADIRVRRAIAYSIDNEKVAKVVGYGLFTSTNQYSVPSSWSYNPAVKGYPYNPQKAKELLTEAGYSKGLDTKLTFPSGEVFLNEFSAAQGYLGAVGINVKLEPVDWGKWTQIQTSGWTNQLVDHDMMCSPGTEDPRKSLVGRISKTSVSFAPTSLYIPDDYNTKLMAAVAQMDKQKAKAQTQELMKIITDDYCLAIPIFGITVPCVRNPQVHDFNMYQFSNLKYDPENAWLSK